MKKLHSPLFFLLFSVVIVTELIWILNSDGFYFIDDSHHFNYNRHVLSSYKESIGLWHRIGRVWLFALPAQFGLKGVQFFSACIFILTIYIGYRILVLKDIRHSELVIPLIGFQPVLFNISFTVLAELPAAFLIVLSYYLYLKERYVAVMIVSSLLFIFRMEYFYVAVIFMIVYIFQRKYISVLLLFTGPAVWFFFSWIIGGAYWSFWHDFLYYSSLPKITEGIGWTHYLGYSPVIFGFIQCILFLSGLAMFIYNRKIREFGILLVIIMIGFIIQTVMASKVFGFSASVGQLRYLAVVGPASGIIAAYGLSRFLNVFESTEEKIVLGIVLVATMFFQGPFTVPFHKKLEIEKVSEHIVSLWKKSYPGYKIISNLHYLANILDEPASGGRNYCKLTPENLTDCEKPLVVWVRELEGSPFVEGNVTLSDIKAIRGMKLVMEFTDTVNHNPDVPFSIFRDETSWVSRKVFDYLTHDQFCWETFDIKVFVKD